MERWTRELWLAGRRLVHTPATTAIVVITLALGIGASAGVFTVFKLLVLDPLPFRDPDSLIRIVESRQSPGQPMRTAVVRGRNMEAWRERSSVLQDMGAGRYRTLTLTGVDGEAERVVGIAATANMLSVLGVEPILGRTFQADEDRPGTPAPVAVISHSLWTRRFGRDPGVVGQDMVIAGQPHTILGVMPPGFRYPYSAEVWIPLGLGPGSFEWDNRRLNVSARLRDGVTVEEARRELDRVAAQLAQDWPDTNAGSGVVIRPIREEVLEGVDQKVVALLWAAVFVLLIGAANVASMMLARMHGKEREIAVRVALGAGRNALIRQVLAEALLLSAAGALVGVLAAAFTAPTLTAMSPVDDLGAFFQDVSIDGKVLAFAGVCALGVALVFGLPAALHATGIRLGPTLRAGPGGGVRRAQRRILDGLVVGEVAVAVILVTGAGLMVRSALNLSHLDLGMDTEGLVTLTVAPSTAGYDLAEDRMALVDALVERVRSLPGVESAALTNFNPFRDQGWGASLEPEGWTPSGPDDQLVVNHRGVTPGWFEAVGTPLVAGRTFTASDGADASGVAILSRSAAERFWPGQDAVGRRVRHDREEDGEPPWLTVVGVVGDVVDYGDLPDTWYRPLRQDPSEFATGELEIFVRTSGPFAPVYEGVRAAVRELDPGLPVFNIEPVADIVRFERRVETFTTLLLSLFAGVGLVLAAVGVFGVLSFVVGRRSRELGLRLALGATPGGLVGRIVAGALAVAAVGLVAGLLGAAVLTRFLESFLFGVSALEPGLYAGMALAVLGVSAAAALLPALRAARTDPRIVMTEE